MLAVILLWLLQDILQLMLMGIVLIPEIFLLGLLFAGLQPESIRGHKLSWYILVAFIGGFLWDLRWTNLPGITAAINGGLLATSFIAWNFLPIQGRDSNSFAVIAFIDMFIFSLVHCFFWKISASVALRLFALQQLIGAVFILVLMFVYRKAVYRRV